MLSGTDSISSTYQLVSDKADNFGSGNGSEFAAIFLAHLPAQIELSDDANCPDAALTIPQGSIEPSGLQTYLELRPISFIPYRKIDL